MSDTPPPELEGFDPRQVDSQYRPFPSFADWSGRTINAVRLERFRSRLDGTDDAAIARARKYVTRASAMDTGALEGLYDVDRGFTFTVAMQQFEWEATLLAKGPEVKELFEAQLGSYDHVVDFATRALPLAEAWIRQLHAEITAPQATYWVQTEIGPQQQPLPHGTYKVHPNHVRTADGKIHAYAPVDLTPAEMHRLVRELEGDEFRQAPPIVQAAYAHYAFVLIHPFADGNGRVARALASVFTCRAFSMPLMILAEHRTPYLAALRAADASAHQAFTDFVFDRCVESLAWASEAVQVGNAPDPETVRSSIDQLYRTRSGHEHQDVDQAALNLVDVLFQQLQTEAVKHRSQYVGIELSRGVADPKLISGEYRKVLPSSPVIDLTGITKLPAKASSQTRLTVQVPRDYATGDEIVVHAAPANVFFHAELPELSPVSTAVVIRLQLFARRVVGVFLEGLRRDAEAALRSGGL